MPELIYVFGYASLVAVPEPGALSGNLRGYRRTWGAAMNNWEGGEGVKHWLDRETGERPHIRVAYLDLREQEGASVNGVAIPVDPERLAAFDAREINYERVDVSAAFEGPVSGRVFAYVGLDAARERCRLGRADGDIYVSREYAAGVRLAFERLGADALAEFERTTDPLPFPERDLQVVLPEHLAGL
ncbi:MAG TPA: gamma-glutamylcyclotransferase family protein [Solirubrobacterales bacterium]